MPNTCSNSCLLCCICGDKRDQWKENVSRHSVHTSQEKHSPWCRCICPRPLAAMAPGRTQSSSPPLGFPPHPSSTAREEKGAVRRTQRHTSSHLPSFLPPSQETLSCNLPLLASARLAFALRVFKKVLSPTEMQIGNLKKKTV